MLNRLKQKLGLMLSGEKKNAELSTIKNEGEGYDYPYRITDQTTGGSISTWKRALSPKEVLQGYHIELPFRIALEKEKERDAAMVYR